MMKYVPPLLWKCYRKREPTARKATHDKKDRQLTTDEQKKVDQIRQQIRNRGTSALPLPETTEIRKAEVS